VKRVYLAGPEVFLRQPLVLAERLKAICAQHGLEGVFPMDGQVQLTPGKNLENGLAIYVADVELMDTCDAAIANMTPFRGPSMDTGTAFEMGYMTAQGKPVFGYNMDSRLYHQKVVDMYSPLELDVASGVMRDKDGNQVEDFHMQDNLMMVGAAMESGPIERNFEMAVIACAAYFKEQELKRRQLQEAKGRLVLVDEQ
jgi:nucleoside 2-deoxyribosyltransferase